MVVQDNLIELSPDISALPLSDYDYDLPARCIAQHPSDKRDQSRLLVIDKISGDIIGDDVFAQLGRYLHPGDLLILNETKVDALRLYGTLATGGRAEVLLTHRVSEGLWQALVKPGKQLKLRATLACNDNALIMEVADVLDERGGRLLRITSNGSSAGTDAMVELLGKTPLPPYIHAVEPNRYKERYQTVYAKESGSAAAPTAGLHFTPELLDRLRARGIETASVVLHVGIGTFRPIEVNDVRQHEMHEERGEIPVETARKIANSHGRIVAVGTTCVRALESAAIGERTVRSGPFATRLFITPGAQFKIVDTLITNFHMPRSTLLVLVSAFAGVDTIRSAYAEAMRRDFRFLSFGDAMLIRSRGPVHSLQ